MLYSTPNHIQPCPSSVGHSMTSPHHKSSSPYSCLSTQWHRVRYKSKLLVDTVLLTQPQPHITGSMSVCLSTPLRGRSHRAVHTQTTAPCQLHCFAASNHRLSTFELAPYPPALLLLTSQQDIHLDDCIHSLPNPSPLHLRGVNTLPGCVKVLI
jgi:hypothetical protein